MKVKSFFASIVVVLIIGSLIITFLFFNESFTGEVINNNLSEIQESSVIQNDSKINMPYNPIEIEIISIEFIEDIDFETLKTTNKLIVEGLLINNLDEDLTGFSSVARFYNEFSRDKPLIQLDDKKNYANIEATNQYINVHKFLLNGNSSLNPFSKGVNSFTITFFNIPSYLSKESYLERGLIKNRDWFEGNYDIDAVDLIIYHNKKEIKKINLDLPQKYISDIALNISGMRWINRGGHRTYLDSLSFTIENPEGNQLKEPKLIITVYDIKTNEQFANFTLNIPKEKINEPLNYVRLVSEEDYLMKFDKEKLSHVAFFDIYDGQNFIDRNYFVWKCGKEKIIDTISYFPCLRLAPEIYMIEESDIIIKIIEEFKGVKEDYYSGLEVKVENKGNTLMQNPVIEIFCGNSWVYNFDNSQINEFINLNFGTSAFCFEPQVLIREKDSSLTYAEDNYEIAYTYRDLQNREEYEKATVAIFEDLEIKDDEIIIIA